MSKFCVFCKITPVEKPNFTFQPHTYLSSNRIQNSLDQLLGCGHKTCSSCLSALRKSAQRPPGANFRCPDDGFEFFVPARLSDLDLSSFSPMVLRSKPAFLPLSPLKTTQSTHKVSPIVSKLIKVEKIGSFTISNPSPKQIRRAKKSKLDIIDFDEDHSRPPVIKSAKKANSDFKIPLSGQKSKAFLSRSHDFLPNFSQSLRVNPVMNDIPFPLSVISSDSIGEQAKEFEVVPLGSFFVYRRPV